MHPHHAHHYCLPVASWQLYRCSSGQRDNSTLMFPARGVGQQGPKGPSDTNEQRQDRYNVDAECCCLLGLSTHPRRAERAGCRLILRAADLLFLSGKQAPSSDRPSASVATGGGRRVAETKVVWDRGGWNGESHAACSRKRRFPAHSRARWGHGVSVAIVTPLCSAATLGSCSRTLARRSMERARLNNQRHAGASGHHFAAENMVDAHRGWVSGGVRWCVVLCLMMSTVAAGTSE